MSSNYIAIGLRILAIIFFFSGIKEAARIIYYALSGLNENFGFSDYSYLILVLAIWLFSFVSWFFAVPISKRIAYGELNFKIEPIAQMTWIAVFVSILGLYILAYGLIDAVYYLLVHLLNRDMGASDDVINPETQVNFLATAFEVTLGLILIIKSRFVARLINDVSK